MRNRQKLFILLGLLTLAATPGVTQAVWVPCDSAYCMDEDAMCAFYNAGADCPYGGQCIAMEAVNCDGGYCGDRKEVICEDAPAEPACNDGVDNDGDNLADHPDDPGCNNKNDGDEYNGWAAFEVRESPNVGSEWHVDTPSDGTIRGWGDGSANLLAPGTFYITIDEDPNGYECTASPESRTINGGQSRAFDITCEAVPSSAPTVDLECSGTGSGYNNGPCTTSSNAYLKWTTSGADSCTASANPSTSTWTGSKSRQSSGTNLGVLDVNSRTYTLTCSNGVGSTSDSVIISKTNNASCVSHTIPSTMTPGESRSVSMTFNNTGGKTWTQAAYDATIWPQPPTSPGMAPVQLEMPNASTAPGANAVFNFTITAPNSNGSYSGQYRLVEQGVEWFGATCGPATITIAGNAPVTSNVSTQEPDYCTVGPSVTVAWNYSDAEGTPQTAYQIQIDDNAGYSSPNYDSGKTSGAITSRYISTGLTWGTVYRARVQTWDGADQASGWVEQTICSGPPGGNPSGCSGDQKSWRSPSNQYPANLTSFTWSPARPPINSVVQFDDGSTTCYRTPPNTVDLPCAAYSWNFGDGTTSTQRDPSHTYTAEGTYNVSLRATDTLNGYSCSASKTINVQKPVPRWKEVLPFF